MWLPPGDWTQAAKTNAVMGDMVVMMRNSRLLWAGTWVALTMIASMKVSGQSKLPTTTTSSSSIVSSPTQSGVDYSYASTISGLGKYLVDEVNGFIQDPNKSTSRQDLLLAIDSLKGYLEEADDILRFAAFFALSNEERRISHSSVNLAGVQYLNSQRGFDIGAVRILGSTSGWGAGFRYNASSSLPSVRGAFAELKSTTRTVRDDLGDIQRAAGSANNDEAFKKLSTRLEDEAKKLVKALNNLDESQLRAVYGLRVGLVFDYVDVAGVRLFATGAGLAKLEPVLANHENVPRYAFLWAGIVRELDSSPADGHKSSRQFGASLAWQWSTGKTRKSKHIRSENVYIVDHAWRVRLGAEVSATLPRIGDDYTGLFLAYRPAHDVELRFFARTTGRTSVFGAKVTVGLP